MRQVPRVVDRATRFAGFNATLNGIENCTAVQGDLYAPVAGRTFDRIVAHPPYMPALEQKYIFRDGGEDGEQITRGIVGGLPTHLARGGSCHCTCMLTDRREARAEQRLRRLLGDPEVEFDILLLAHQSFQPTEYYFQLALAGRATLEEVQRRHETFRRLEVERLVYASIVLRRHDGPRPAYTARRQAGAEHRPPRGGVARPVGVGRGSPGPTASAHGGPAWGCRRLPHAPVARSRPGRVGGRGLRAHDHLAVPSGGEVPAMLAGGLLEVPEFPLPIR